MTTDQAVKIYYRKDYRKPNFIVDSIDLHFTLGEEFTLVKSTLAMRREKSVESANHPLELDGEHMELESVSLNNKKLSANEYKCDDESLVIHTVPDQFILEIITKIKPQENKALTGLYKSSGNFCTQCEAHGFRRITYYLDRPDVMSIFTTTIVADKTLYPKLLSNGNLIEAGDLANNQHWVKWHDPHKKPCYLFALVAGDLEYIEDHFVTMSKRKVTLQIFVEKGNKAKAYHAMDSLKKSMTWDEQVYGREYDLDIFMIVAVSDFNMGAMENKGLNIFNDKYILAKPETATDLDYQNILMVVGHEYFHNWSGNRVTCRDWFQLSLKEGFTVFRDQEFTADMFSRAVKRIADVRILRTSQFPQDAGPMAHPVRPDSYIEMNNFYTVTVYNKGAEVIRMMHAILGASGFRKGTDLYFSRHDGQAVTCDDFVKAMEDANNIDLSQFRLWYSQAGTPIVEVDQHYDLAKQLFTVTFKQHCSATPDQTHKEPFHIPMRFGLLGDNGQELKLSYETEEGRTYTSDIFHIQKPTQQFQFKNVKAKPVLSLLRNFSAPVLVKANYSDDELAFLLAHDTDSFSRWDAGQQLAINTILKLVKTIQQNGKLTLSDNFIKAFANVLHDTELDKAFIAEVFNLPSDAYLANLMTEIDIDAIHMARNFVVNKLAEHLAKDFKTHYLANQDNGQYSIDNQAIAKRRLKNTCLDYMMRVVDSDKDILQICTKQYTNANNMTDCIVAFSLLANQEHHKRDEWLTHFYEKWQHEPLVMDKWLTVQAMVDLPDTLARVKQLMKHPVFNIKNPNKARALIGSFCSGNTYRFHDKSGSGYQFLAEQVLAIDAFNPQTAARITEPFLNWKRYDKHRQKLIQQELEKILEHKISKDVYELVSKALKN